MYTESDEAYQKVSLLPNFHLIWNDISSELKNVLFLETSDFEDNERSLMLYVCSLILETVGRIDVLASGRNINIEPKCETMFVDTKKKCFASFLRHCLKMPNAYVSRRAVKSK